MRMVHILGLGFIVGMVALGAMLSVIGYRWQEANYQAQPTQTGFPPASAPGPAAPQEVAQGKALFQQRCSSCHSIGGGKKVGPDLKGVTQTRPHDWLVEFISDPQAVIARNDPTIQELLGQYQVQMPNTGTSKAEAENILVYIQSESQGGVGNIQTAPGNTLTPGPPGVSPTAPAGGPGRLDEPANAGAARSGPNPDGPRCHGTCSG